MDDEDQRRLSSDHGLTSRLTGDGLKDPPARALDARQWPLRRQFTRLECLSYLSAPLVRTLVMQDGCQIETNTDLTCKWGGWEKFEVHLHFSTAGLTNSSEFQKKVFNVRF